MRLVSKEDAERVILERFLVAYQKRFDMKLVDVVHRDKPDFEVTNAATNEKIGIEVTGAYQNKREAIIQYGLLEDEAFEGSIEEFQEHQRSACG